MAPSSSIMDATTCAMSGNWILGLERKASIERLPSGLQIASSPPPMPFRLFLLLFFFVPFWASGFVGGGAGCLVDGVLSQAERPSSISKALGRGEATRGLLFVYDGWTKRGGAETDARDRVVSASAGTSRRGCPLGARRSNLVAEFEVVASQPQLRRSYLWGQDLSGSLDGGGGVGGLLAVAEADGASYFPLYDANGNVSEYIDAAGAVAAHYLYGPFGEQLVAAGPLAESFAFRFSTKRRDGETGLLYYGMRYYEPRLGRWLSPDPAEEAGGLNLYGFLGNDGVNRWDLLGMMPGDALGDPDLSIDTVMGLPSPGSALATQLGVGGILSLEDSRRKAEQYAAIGCKEEALQFMSDALRQASLELGLAALRVAPGGYGLGKALSKSAVLRNILSKSRAVQSRVRDAVARSSQRTKKALNDAAHKVKPAANTGVDPDIYKASLRRFDTPNTTAAGQWEIANTGRYNYTVTGGGTKLDVDGIIGTTIQEAKFIKGNPANSPFVKGKPTFIIDKVDDEFSRMSKIIADPSNPLTDVEVIINHADAKPFFIEMLKKHGLNGRIVVR